MQILCGLPRGCAPNLAVRLVGHTVSLLDQQLHGSSGNPKLLVNPDPLHRFTMVYPSQEKGLVAVEHHQSLLGRLPNKLYPQPLHATL